MSFRLNNYIFSFRENYIVIGALFAKLFQQLLHIWKVYAKIGWINHLITNPILSTIDCGIRIAWVKFLLVPISVGLSSGDIWEGFLLLNFSIPVGNKSELLFLLLVAITTAGLTRSTDDEDKTFLSHIRCFLSRWIWKDALVYKLRILNLKLNSEKSCSILFQFKFNFNVWRDLIFHSFPLHSIDI